MAELATEVSVVRAALLYQGLTIAPHLKQALLDSGVEFVIETSADRLDRSTLENSGAEVIVINLEPELEDHLDQITELLDALDRPMIFNDAQASAGLAGWDQARWARHLAAKLRGEISAHPPRPPGAEAIPAPKLAARAPAPAATPRAAPAVPVPAPPAEPAKAAEAPVRADKLPDTKEIPVITEVTVPAVASQAQPAEESVEADPFADLSAILGAFEAPVEASAPESAGDDAGMSFLDIPDEPSPPAQELTDLDELFRKMAPIEATDIPTRPAAPPAAAKPAEPPPPAKPNVAAKKDAPLEWSLEPLDLETEAPAPAPAASGRASFKVDAPAPAAPTQAKAASPAKFGEPPVTADSDELPPLDFDLSGFEKALEAAAPAKPAPVQAAPAAPPARPAPAQPAPVSTSASKPAAAPVVASAKPASRTDTLPDLGLSIEEFEALGFETFKPEAVTPIGGDSGFDDVFAEIEAPESTNATSADLLPDLNRLVVLGASIGGPEAVRSFLAGLKPTVGCAFVLAQHMGAEFIELMAAQLDKGSPVRVSCAQDGERIRHGQVVVVPVGKRLTIDAAGNQRLGKLPSESPYSPSIDQVLMDMADRFGSRCSAIIFSGMASDAIEGAKYLKARGGDVWVQDPASCVISSMIDGALAAGVVSFQGSPEALAARLMKEL